MNGVRLLLRLLWWSPVRYLVPVFAGVEAAALLNQGMQWRGEWSWTVDWVGGAVLLLGPLVSGLAVWQVAGAATRLGESAHVVAQPRRATVAALVGVIGWAWACHLLGLAVALALTASAGATGVPNLLPVLPQLLVIAGYAGLGAMLGALVPNVLMAPLTSLVLLVCTTQFASGALPSLWVTVGGATTSLAGLRYTPAVLATQVLLGAAVLALGLSVRRTAMGPVEVNPALGVLPLVAVLGSGTWLATTDDQRIEPDPAPVRLSCAGEDPVVCVRPENAAVAAPLRSAFHALSVAARDLGAEPPRRFDQIVANQPQPEGTRAFVLNPGTVTPAGVDIGLVVHYFVLDRACLTGEEAPPADAVARLESLGLLLAVQAGFLDRDQVGDPAAKSLLALDPDRQARFVTDALAASYSCRFADVPTLP